MDLAKLQEYKRRHRQALGTIKLSVTTTVTVRLPIKGLTDPLDSKTVAGNMLDLDKWNDLRMDESLIIPDYLRIINSLLI